MKEEAAIWPEWMKAGSHPYLIAGPCSVESEQQIMQTASAIAKTGLASALRGGVWKPRTSPGNFEGMGAEALPWLKKAGEANNLPVITEVANARHVEQALKAGIDMLWIGARTTVNPFYVQEIADALRGVDIPVMVKNPIHPEVKLWLGAIERVKKAGVNKLVAIHRGFFSYQSQVFRNEPRWEVYFELRRLDPDLPVICDPSHIAGKRELLKEVCQSAIDLGIGGFMIETHIDPAHALSDPEQQVTPEALETLIRGLETRTDMVNDDQFIHQLEHLRSQIDRVDEELLATLKRRIQIVEEIGEVKNENQVTIFQMKRWFSILENRKELALKLNLDPQIVHELFQAIHKYSIDVQIKAKAVEKS